MNRIGLKDSDYDLLVNELSKDQRVEKALVFGSRAKGTHKLYSDIDIALVGDLSAFGAEEIKRELDELPLCQKIDVLDYATIRNAALRDHIDRVGIKIFDRQSLTL